VRELRNLVESMVVLAPGHEIGPDDIPRPIREGANGRLLPVAIGPVLRGEQGTQGRELEFIVRSLVELKLQVEELRRRMDEERTTLRGAWVGEVPGGSPFPGLPMAGAAPIVVGLEPREQAPPPNVVTIAPGMTMAEIERAAIEAALKETRGNRRRAAEMLGIGERTLYRKLQEYQPADSLALMDERGDLDHVE
jgi:DNA-binding NtrC family response regulator